MNQRLVIGQLRTCTFFAAKSNPRKNNKITQRALPSIFCIVKKSCLAHMLMGREIYIPKSILLLLMPRTALHYTTD